MKRILAFVLLTLSLVSVGLAASARPLPEAPSQQDKNKAVARRVFDEIFNEGKFEVADEIYAKDFANHGLHRDFGLQEEPGCGSLGEDGGSRPKDNRGSDDGGRRPGHSRVDSAGNKHRADRPPASNGREDRRAGHHGVAHRRWQDSLREWTSFDLLHILRQVLGQLKWTLMGLLYALL